MKKNEKTIQKKEKKQFNIYKLFTVLLAAILLVIIGIMLRNWIVERNAEKQYEDLAESVNRLQNQDSDNAINSADDRQNANTEKMEEESQDSQEQEDSAVAGINIPQKQLDWNELAKVNPDIYAWIYVPGTRIDYPVALNQEDDTHYLKYNFKNEPEFAGCIYTEKANKKDFTDPNTIFYGHNMRNGSMFQNLHKFEDEQFFNKHKEVYVYTPKKTYTYTIFAAYKFDDRHLLKTFNFKNKAKFENYLRNVKNIRDMESHIRTKQKVTSSDKIITLSTCVGGQPHNRYLVQAVLTDERSAE